MDIEIERKIAKEILVAFKKHISEQDFAAPSGNLETTIEYKRSGSKIEIWGAKYGIYLEEGTDGAVGKKGVGDRDKKYKLSELSGRKKPPIEAIEPWAKKMGFNPSAVAMSIKKFGTKAHPFMKSFYDTIDDIVFDNLEEDLDHLILKTLYNK